MGEQDDRHGLVYPDDGEEAPADGKTRSTPADLDPAATDWGDVIQALIWHLNRHGGQVGDVANRPAAGADAPRFWLSIGATDAAPTLYFNDETGPQWLMIDAGSLDGHDSTEFAVLAENEEITGAWIFGTGSETQTFRSTVRVEGGPEDGGDAMIELVPTGTGLDSQIRWYDSDGTSKVSYWWDSSQNHWNAYDQDTTRYLFRYHQNDARVNWMDVDLQYRGSEVTTKAAETIPNQWAFDGGLTFHTMHGDVVWGGHPDFATAQAAIDYAKNNDVMEVRFPAGQSYDSIDVLGGIRVRGYGDIRSSAPIFEGRTDDHAVDMTSGSSIFNVRVRSDNSTTGLHGIRTDTGGRNDIVQVTCLGAAGDAFHIRNNYLQITGCYTLPGQVNGEGVMLTSNTNYCLVDGNMRMGSIVDNGGGNVIGSNS